MSQRYLSTPKKSRTANYEYRLEGAVVCRNIPLRESFLTNYDAKILQRDMAEKVWERITRQAIN